MGNILTSAINTNLPESYNPRDHTDTPAEALDLNPMSYPNIGLYHSTDHLQFVYPAILHYPIETQMQYADAITRRYALNPHFLELQRKGMSISVHQLRLSCNSTTVGNMACMAYYNGLDSEWGQYYCKMIEQLKDM